MSIKTAKGIRFSTGDYSRFCDLIEEMYTVKQGNMPVTDYFTKMKIVWDEMSILRPLPSCDDANCQAVRANREISEADQIVSFLKGLNDDFAAIKSHVLMMYPLPSLQAVFSMAIKHERRMNYGLSHSQSGEPMAMASRVFIPPGQGSNDFSGQGFRPATKENFQNFQNLEKKPQCTFCGYIGHTVDKCCRKHDFSPGYQSKSKAKPMANQVSVNEGEYGDQPAITAMEDTNAWIGATCSCYDSSLGSSDAPRSMTQEQYLHLVQLLQLLQNNQSQTCPQQMVEEHSANTATAVGKEEELHFQATCEIMVDPVEPTWVMPTPSAPPEPEEKGMPATDAGVSDILRRLKREDLIKKGSLRFRGFGFIFSLLAFIIMASNKHGNWMNFDNYEEYRYVLGIAILSTLYTGRQIFSRQNIALVDFIGDQVVAYLLLSAASSAVPLTNKMRENNHNAFTDSSASAISMTFLAFLSLAVSAIISSYNLSTQTCV